MIDQNFKVLLFVKDFTGRGGDFFYWLEGNELKITTPSEIVGYAHPIVCHDFWLIRDLLFDVTGDLPPIIVDLDELRISTSGYPEDRLSREDSDITEELERFGVSPDNRSAYTRMFHRSLAFDPSVAIEVGNAMISFYHFLLNQARANGEYERFVTVELGVYRILQKAMSAGIAIDSTQLTEKRREAEHDYFLFLKDYSKKHDMPLENPSSSAIAERLEIDGFQLDGVSTQYVLEFLPHPQDFGNDTLALQNLGAARRVLSSLTLSMDRTRPIIDVFGSRTSRVTLRSPSLQNLPKKSRSIITASAGARLSYVDFDQYEVGIMAALSGDEELSRLYSAGDMYDIFATTYLELPGNRKVAKQLFLSYAYGMSRKALIDAAVSLGASRERAKSAFRLFIRYEEWKSSIWAEFSKNGHISSLLGNHYKRTNQGPLTPKEQRSAVSQVVQGTASLIFKKVIQQINNIADVRIVLPMHDALLFEYRRTNTPNEVIEVFQTTMTSILGGKIAGKASISSFTL